MEARKAMASLIRSDRTRSRAARDAVAMALAELVLAEDESENL